jgi:hypothetical protein
MVDKGAWSWEEGKKQIADLSQARETYSEVHESVTSPDGERIAVPVVKGPDDFGVWVNGDLWDGDFEKAWHLKFSPDGKLTALVRIDDEWTAAVEGQAWESRWEFAWNTRFNDDGSAIAVQIKDNMQYSIAVNGAPWERTFHSCRGFVLSQKGSKVAAVVQVEPLAEGDIFGFMNGTWTVAVDGVPWENRFINTYAPVLSADSTNVAVEVRLDICEYTLAVDGEALPHRFGCIWEPCYRNAGSGGLLAPVRLSGAWTLVEDGEPIWNGRYMQLWNQRLSPDGGRVAAVAAQSFGRWTVVVDDVPWRTSFGRAVRPPVFSDDGARVAAAVRDVDRWTIAVDGKPWNTGFDMVWDPGFVNGGDSVLAKVEKDGRFAIAKNGSVWTPWFEALWDPVVSPDGSKALLKYIDDSIYTRQVVSINDAVES